MNDSIIKMLLYAYDNSPFYQSFYSKKLDINKISEMDISEIPLLKKEDIYLYTLRMISKRWYNEFAKNKLIKITTSGSTGLCLDIFWSEQDMNNSLLRLWFLRKKYYNINPNDKCCAFYSNIKGTEQLLSDKLLSFSKSNLTESRLHDIYCRIKEFKPKYMIMEPSIALLLVNHMKRKNLESIESIKYIELTGEYLSKQVKKSIKIGFNCSIANQYGTYEVNSIAYECPEGFMHCMEDNVFVEILDKKGEKVISNQEGDIYITSLMNTTMPFIRYKIGDRGRICRNIKCKCKNHAAIIDITNGRSNDTVLCRDGSKIHSSIFVKVIDNINECFDKPIIQYQIHQIDYEEFTILCVLDNQNMDINFIANKFCSLISEDRLVGAKINFIVSDNLLPDDNTGKLKYFINDMKVE